MYERVWLRLCRAHSPVRVLFGVLAQIHTYWVDVAGAEDHEDFDRLGTEDVAELKLELFGWVTECEAYTKDMSEPFGELIQHRGKAR